MDSAIGPFIREKINHGLLWLRLTQDANCSYKQFTAQFAQDRSNDDKFCFGAPPQFSTMNRASKKRNDWLWSGKLPYFTLSFSFQINISVKIRAGLLQNLCGNLDQRFVSDQSSGLKENFQRWRKWSLDEIYGSLVQQFIFPPLQRASLGCESLGYN